MTDKEHLENLQTFWKTCVTELRLGVIAGALLLSIFLIHETDYFTQEIGRHMLVLVQCILCAYFREIIWSDVRDDKRSFPAKDILLFIVIFSALADVGIQAFYIRSGIVAGMLIFPLIIDICILCALIKYDQKDMRILHMAQIAVYIAVLILWVVIAC